MIDSDALPIYYAMETHGTHIHVPLTVAPSDQGAYSKWHPPVSGYRQGGAVDGVQAGVRTGGSVLRTRSDLMCEMASCRLRCNVSYNVMNRYGRISSPTAHTCVTRAPIPIAVRPHAVV